MTWLAKRTFPKTRNSGSVEKLHRYSILHLQGLFVDSNIEDKIGVRGRNVKLHAIRTQNANILLHLPCSILSPMQNQTREK